MHSIALQLQYSLKWLNCLFCFWACAPSYVYPAVVNIAVARQRLLQERQGKPDKLISMSLYGNSDRYTKGALRNAVLAQQHWKGWKLRFYHDDTVPKDILKQLAALGAELSQRQSGSGQLGMFWRFLPAGDPTLTRYIVRDSDARLTPRDRAAVKEWEESDYLFHTMRDNPNHRFPIMGGMWGAVGGLVNASMFTHYLTHHAHAAKKDDQFFLQDCLFPAVRNVSLCHASFSCRFREAEQRGFPTQREGGQDFVGNAFMTGEDDSGLELKRMCPKPCRRKPEWTTC